MPMSAELKGCVTWFIYFFDLPLVRYNCAKFHHCRIWWQILGMGPKSPPICEQPLKSPSWIGLRKILLNQSNILSIPPLNCSRTDIMLISKNMEYFHQQNLQNLDHHYRKKYRICKCKVIVPQEFILEVYQTNFSK